MHTYFMILWLRRCIKKKFPDDIIMLDFKASDSLIESLDMNSKFDARTAIALKSGAVDFTGDSDALINFLSFTDVAPELMKYFETNESKIENPVTIDPGSGEVTLNKEFFLEESGDVKISVVSHVSKFLQQNQSRLSSMRALLQAAQTGEVDGKGGLVKGGGSPATQLLANYMKKATITIHGTTNVKPFTKVIIKGIMPNLEGMYLITSTRDSITPQGFQTILEGDTSATT